jgi:isomerase DpgB
MTVGRELPELADGLEVDGAQPLAELTAIVGAACDRIDARDTSSAIVLRLGMTRPDRGSWPGDVPIHAVNRWERTLRRLQRLAALVIAVADGTCGGPALELLLSADHRIATPRLVLVLPTSDGTFWPGMSIFWLVQHLGVAAARQIVMWGQDIPAARALELGLVDQVTERLDESVRLAVSLMGRVPTSELAVRRQLLFEATSATYEDALGVHLAACDRELRRRARTQVADHRGEDQ